MANVSVGVPRLYMNKNDLIKMIICLIPGILFWYLIPAPPPLTEVGMRVIGVFITCVMMLTIVDTAWPVIFCFLLMSRTGVMNLNQVFAASIGNWITVFVIMSFILAKALEETGFTGRMAAWVLSRKFTSKSPWAFTFAMMFLGVLTAALMNQVPATAFVLALNARILKSMGYTSKDGYSHLLTMTMVFGATIGGIWTPMGSSIIVLAMGIFATATGTVMTFAQYLVFSTPVAIAIFLTTFGIIRAFAKPDFTKFKEFDVKKIMEELKPADLREKVVTIVYFFTVTVWLLPGILSLIAPTSWLAVFLRQYDITFWAVVAVVALSVIRIDDQPVVSFKKTIEDKFGWGIVFFVTNGSFLGAALTNPAVGLEPFIMSRFTPVIEALGPWGIIIALGALTLFFTNASASIVAVTVFCGFGMTLATAGVIPAMPTAMVVGFLAAATYTLPSGFAHIAMLHGDEFSDSLVIYKFGIPIMVINLIYCVFIGFPIASALFG